MGNPIVICPVQCLSAESATDKGTFAAASPFAEGQIYDYWSLPLHYRCFVLEITNRCTARCAICYQNTEKYDAKRGIDLCEMAAKRAILDAAQSPAVCKRFHIAGGEAFLDIPKLVRLFKYARAAGFLQITATTNAYWAKSISKAKQVAIALRGAGVTSLEVSTDYWHQYYVHPQAIDNCVQACKDVQIGIVLRILSTASHGVQATLDTLQPQTLQKVDEVVPNDVLRIGNAAWHVGRNEVTTRSLSQPWYVRSNPALAARSSCEMLLRSRICRIR